MELTRIILLTLWGVGLIIFTTQIWDLYKKQKRIDVMLKEMDKEIKELEQIKMRIIFEQQEDKK